MSSAPVQASQSAAPPAGAPAPNGAVPPQSDSSGAPAITVTGQRPAVTTSIDRRSYAVGRDIQSSSGSAADIMRNIPSVTVDVDGNPSLRGDANVQILINGRPAPTMNGANRGATLQQMGADSIDRIEVLTNPPANFSPNGSAGVINIVTKRSRAGRSASFNANLGSGLRFNLGGTGAVQLGALNVHGGLTLRRDRRVRISTDERRTTDPTSGAFVSASRQSVANYTDRLSKIVTLGADLDLTRVDRISAEGSYNYRAGHPSGNEEDAGLDASGAPISLSRRAQHGWEREVASSASLRYRHRIGTDGGGLTILAQRSETAERQVRNYQNFYNLPALPSSLETQNLYGDEIVRELSAEFIARLPGRAKLTVGYDLERDDDTYDNAAARLVGVAGTPVPDPGFTNRFVYGQTIHAAYASFERPIARWTILAGLRVEQVFIQTNQVTSGLRGANSYFRAYPTLHLNYDLSDRHTLSFSYGHRVTRPEPDDLNPYPLQQDAFTLRQGNPRLLPQEIHSLEAGWSYSHGATARSATLYLRQTSNGFTDIRRQISPTLLLVTKENLGASTAGGLELASSGHLISRLDYNLSGNVYYNRIDAANLGFAGTRSSWGYEARAAFNWHATSRDTAQVNFSLVGRRLTPQGYRPTSGAVDLGFRHQIWQNLAVTATVSDLLETRRDGIILATPGFTDVAVRRQSGRIAFVGLSWTLRGARAPAADRFNYEN